MVYKLCFGFGALIVIYLLAFDNDNIYVIITGIVSLIIGTGMAMRKVSEAEQEDSLKNKEDEH